MATGSTAMNANNLGRAFDISPESEVRAVIMKIPTVDLGGDEVGGLLGEAEVGESGKILGRNQLQVVRE